MVGQTGVCNAICYVLVVQFPLSQSALLLAPHGSPSLLG